MFKIMRTVNEGEPVHVTNKQTRGEAVATVAQHALAEATKQTTGRMTPQPNHSDKVTLSSAVFSSVERFCTNGTHPSYSVRFWFQESK